MAPARVFLLDAGIMPYLDTTGAAVLGQVRGELERQPDREKGGRSCI